MGAPAAPRVILTPEQTTAAIVDLSNGMAEMRLMMQSILQYLHVPTLPFQDVQATAPIPIHQPWMPPSPLPIPSYAMASTMGPVYTMASTTVATTKVAPAPTTGAVVLSGGPSLQHPFTDGIFYRGAGVQQIQDAGEKSRQIEQPTDIAMEPAGKMLPQ